MRILILGVSGLIGHNILKEFNDNMDVFHGQPEATKSTKGNNSKGNKNGYYLHVLMHGIFQHFTDLSSVVKGMHLILDYSTDIYPGAEYELAYQLLRKQKEEKKDDTYDENTDFYCFDRCYTTTCDRIWAGMSWSELYNFYCDINKISELKLK